MISLLHEQKRKGHNRIFNGYILVGLNMMRCSFFAAVVALVVVFGVVLLVGVRVWSVVSIFHLFVG